MLPAHFMVAGYFARRIWKISSAVSRSSASGRRRHGQLDAENDPLFVFLENALAIAKAALWRAERPNRRSVQESHLPHALVDGMAIGARVAINRRSHRSGNAGHRFEAAQPVIDANNPPAPAARPRPAARTVSSVALRWPSRSGAARCHRSRDRKRSGWCVLGIAVGSAGCGAC